MESYVEVEAKIYLRDFASLRELILERGGRAQGKAREENIWFDDEKGSLGKRDSLFRLRRDLKCWLTFKGPQEKGSDFKKRVEREVEVRDFEKARELLKSLGYREVLTYEKERESFSLLGCELALDTLPYGKFMEIEGREEDIEKVLSELGLAERKKIVKSYVEIFLDIKRLNGLDFRDLTFRNFEGLKLKLPQYLK